VARFLEPNAIRPCMWHIKYNLLRRLFEHCALLGTMPPLLMPDRRVRVRSNFVPYVYTQAEIRRLLQGASNIESRRTSASEARSFRMMLFLLYSTGMTLGEVVRLRRQDCDLKRRSIAVYSPRPSRHRSIPIDAYICTIVRDYFKWRFPSPGEDGCLFMRDSGRGFDEEVTQRYFGRMVRRLRLARRDSVSAWPRIADLRATFAVNRITEWLRDGTEMNKMLPALAAYLGHIGLYSVDRYLRLTPERFRKQLCALSPRQTQKHWRDDELTMKFLASL
jgi:site-specific recombinase XerD